MHADCMCAYIKSFALLEGIFQPFCMQTDSAFALIPCYSVLSSKEQPEIAWFKSSSINVLLQGRDSTAIVVKLPLHPARCAAEPERLPALLVLEVRSLGVPLGSAVVVILHCKALQ